MPKAGAIRRLWAWGGWPFKALLALLAMTLLGTIGAMVLAPSWPIPLIGLFAILASPFPTALCYAFVALFVNVIVRVGLGSSHLGRSTSLWIAASITVVMVVGLGTGLAKYLNSEAGIQKSGSQKSPPALAFRAGGEIALIDYGDPDFVRCESLCLSLLLEQRATGVWVGSSLSEPAPTELVRGRRYYLTPQTRTCLKGQRAYYFRREEEPEYRHREFIEIGSTPREYADCLGSEPADIDPSRQVTLVEWVKGDEASDSRRPGYTPNVALIRTVVPTGGRAPEVRQARYRSGWKYSDPLSIWPYAGNAGSGGYFSPSVSVQYFRDAGFPETVHPPFLSLLRDGHELGISTAVWLDTVVKPPER